MENPINGQGSTTSSHPQDGMTTLEKFLGQIKSLYFSDNKGFILKSCSRTREFFLINGDETEKEKQKKMLISYFKNQKKTLYLDAPANLNSEHTNDVLCFTEPKKSFKEGTILATDGFLTRTHATRDLQFLPNSDGSYNKDVENFCEEEDLALRSEIFFSGETYNPNIKLATGRSLNLMENADVFHVENIHQKAAYIENVAQRRFKHGPVVIKHFYEKGTKTKQIKTFVGDLKEPILDFGVFDVIFTENAGVKKYHRFIEGFVVVSTDLKKKYLIVKKMEELVKESQYITDANDHSAILSNKITGLFVHPNKPAHYDEFIKIIEKVAFKNIISSTTPITKTCSTSEYITIKNLSDKYATEFFPYYKNPSKENPDKSTIVVYPYKSLPSVKIQNGVPADSSDKGNCLFEIKKEESLSTEIGNTYTKYSNEEALKPLGLAIRGSDEKGKAYIFDLKGYVNSTKPLVYNCCETTVPKVNILPYRIFYIDSTDAINIGVFDCIRTQSGEELIILDATIYLNKEIANSFRDLNTRQEKKRFIFSQSNLYAGLGIPSAYLPVPISGASPIRLDIVSGSYTSSAIGSRGNSPLKDTINSSILLLKLAAAIPKDKGEVSTHL